MIISSDGELVLRPIEGAFPSELEDIYQAACAECDDFGGRGDDYRRRGLLPGQGGALNPRQPENLEHLALSVGTVTVGYAAVYRDFPGKSFVELMFLYIAPPARGTGSGTRAMENLSRYFAQTGYGTMRVRVGLDEREAMRFFYRAGFTRPLELRPAADLSDEDFVMLTLEKDLYAAR